MNRCSRSNPLTSPSMKMISMLFMDSNPPEKCSPRFSRTAQAIRLRDDYRKLLGCFLFNCDCSILFLIISLSYIKDEIYIQKPKLWWENLSLHAVERDF